MATIAGTYFIKLPCVNVNEEKDTESVWSLHRYGGSPGSWNSRQWNSQGITEANHVRWYSPLSQLSTGVQQYESESILEQLSLFNHSRNTAHNENILLINPFSLHPCFSHTLCNSDWNIKSGKICTSTKYLWGSQSAHQSLPFLSLRESIGLFPDMNTRIYMSWLLAVFRLIVAINAWIMERFLLHSPRP